MNRSLAGFLLFCAAVAGLLGLAALWVGPQVLTLAFDDEQRNQPIWVLSFSAPPVDDTDGFEARQVAPMRALLSGAGAAGVWRGRLQQMPQGRLRDEWQHLEIFHFKLAGEFVQVATSTEFRALEDPELGSRRLILATQAPPVTFTRSRALVVLLIEEAQASPEAQAGLTVNLALAGGELLWETPVQALEVASAEAWNRLLVAGFPNTDAAEAWVADSTSETERSIAAVRYNDMATLLFAQ